MAGKKEKKETKNSALFSSSSITERYLRTKVCADYDTERERERESLRETESKRRDDSVALVLFVLVYALF